MRRSVRRLPLAFSAAEFASCSSRAASAGSALIDAHDVIDDDLVIGERLAHAHGDIGEARQVDLLARQLDGQRFDQARGIAATPGGRTGARVRQRRNPDPDSCNGYRYHARDYLTFSDANVIGARRTPGDMSSRGGAGRAMQAAQQARFRACGSAARDDLLDARSAARHADRHLVAARATRGDARDRRRAAAPAPGPAASPWATAATGRGPARRVR